ncbi:DUF2513 domain-containing protein [Bacillus pumilus]|uniref:DUF2513 domain-containing protein n=1 Tax=Bacillus pumilus TaxID=1408 RepID=UPI0031F5BF33
MKLNHDCVRLLMLEFEEKLGLNDDICLSDIKSSKIADQFGQDETIYCVTKLIETEYLIGSIQRGGNEIWDIIVSSISFSGHEFLDNIRDDGIWKDTKAKISQLASVSLPTVSQVAAAFIKSRIGL